MKVLRRIPARPLTLRRPVAAIGIFDGVHRGHQVILRKAVAMARSVHGTPVAVTFYPHPLAILNPKLVPVPLLSLEQRLEAFASCGIRVALVLPFTRRFSGWTPEEFVRRVLIDCLKARKVVVGHDFGFGKRRSGSVATLKGFGGRFGFEVYAVGPVALAGERIASRRIRQVIQQGEVEKAAQLLSRPPTVVGRVVHGAGRGSRATGFPTANLHPEAGVLPPVGVYAVWGRLQGRRYPGVANVGFRPTFSNGTANSTRRPVLEVHLFGVRRPLYGERLEVAFLKGLRPERRFPSPGALAQAIARDVRAAKRLFALQSKRRVI